MITDRMTKQDIKLYLVLDMALAKSKTEQTGKKHHHGLSNEDVHHLREAMRNLGIGKDGWGFDYVPLKGDGFDSETRKAFFPNEFYTAEEKREIEDEMWIHAMPSQYDCTGQAFTITIDFFEVPKGTWIYHRIGYDY